MFKPFIFWFAISSAAAGGAFFAVRTAFSPLPEVVPAQAPAVGEKPDAMARPGAEQPEEPLLKRLRFLDRLAASDSAGLRQIMQDAGIGRQEKRVAAQRWAATDPAGLLGFLKGMSRKDWDRDAEQFDAVRDILFSTWAVQDPEAALAAADALGNRPQFRAALGEIVRTLFGTDPAKAFAAAGKLPSYLNTDPMADSVWQKNPAGFLKAAGEAPAGSFRNRQVHNAIDNAFGEWLKTDPAAAAAWLKARPPEQQRKLWSRMAGIFAGADPAGAQAWFNDTPPSAEREKAGAEIVRVLAKKDPHTALEWLQDHLQGGRTAGFTYLAEALAEQGVDAAKQLMDAMPPGAQRDAVVATIARKWADKEFKPAMGWVLSLPPDDPGRREAIRQQSHQWAGKDLAGAAAYLRDQASPAEALNLMWNVSRQYMEKDMAGGFAWAETLPDATRGEAYNSFFREAFQRNKTREVFAAVEKLTSTLQQDITVKITDGVMNTSYGDSEITERFVNTLKAVPPHLREVARKAVGKNLLADEAKKQAALNALK